MPGKKKEKEKKQGVSFINSNECSNKEGDNCKEPGVFSDSAPIGGG